MKTYNYIYLITNKINGKIYIGKHSTNNLNDNYMGSGVLLRIAKQKYGIKNFTKEYLAFCDTEETLNYLEKFYIKKYKAKEVGYNISEGGDGGALFIGKQHSEETKRKIREARKRQIYTEETKRKMSESRKGKHHTKETNQKISDANKGIKVEKFKWLTPKGEIKEMDISNAKRWHKDWVLLK